MPSPEWRAAYQNILHCLSPDVPVPQWGDIDKDGWRIAAKLSDTTRNAGFTLRPWLMSPGAIPMMVGTGIDRTAPLLPAT